MVVFRTERGLGPGDLKMSEKPVERPDIPCAVCLSDEAEAEESDFVISTGDFYDLLMEQQEQM